MFNLVKKVLFICIGGLLLFSFSACTDEKEQQPASQIKQIPGDFDFIISSGDEYNLVVKRIDEFEGSYEMIGVIDDDGNWLHELSKDHYFIEDSFVKITYQGATETIHIGGNLSADEQKTQERIYNIQHSYRYLGEGMFAAVSGAGNSARAPIGPAIISADTYDMYNASANFGFIAGKCTSLTRFADGYAFAFDGLPLFSDVKRISNTGEIKTIAPSGGGAIGAYSEGLFYYNKKFYDIDGNEEIDLSDLAGDISNVPYFENGKSHVEIENSSGVVYYTEMDKEGNMLFEPIKK